MFEKQYRLLVSEILNEGHLRSTRAGQAYSMFGKQLSFDMTREFPLLKGRRINWKSVAGELAALLKGSTHIDDFKKRGCHFWDDWADEKGNINLDYGRTWIDFNGVNQLVQLIEGLKFDQTGRRHIITGWRPETADKVDLPCCHMLYQWYVNQFGELEMLWFQRSADLMVGVPSDMVTAALLNLLVAQTVSLKPGKVTMVFGDVHIYTNHLVGVNEYLRYTNDMYLTQVYPNDVELDDKANVFNFEPEMLKIVRYNVENQIKFKLNV